MKAYLQRILPAPLLRLAIRLYALATRVYDFGADRRRYARYAMLSESAVLDISDLQLEAQITRDYHRIEKGLALSDPKRPFGADLLRRLNALLPIAEARMPNAAFVIAARSAHSALLAWNAGGEVDDAVAPAGSEEDTSFNVAHFFSTRHSVRDFGSKFVEDGLLHQAIVLAGLSPSVCNRQPWNVRLYRYEEAREILRYQGGNSGFGNSVPVVAVIAVDLRHFAGACERNQAWIDGGIFATSFMWALHGLGLATCMLNLSLTTSPFFVRALLEQYRVKRVLDSDGATLILNFCILINITTVALNEANRKSLQLVSRACFVAAKIHRVFASQAAYVNRQRSSAD